MIYDRDLSARVDAQIAALGDRRRAACEQIIMQVAVYYGYTVAEMVGDRRPRHLVAARHLAMKICRDEGYSLTEIGRAFGGRDHTTVVNALRKFGQ